jgi:hypothetical protein
VYAVAERCAPQPKKPASFSVRMFSAVRLSVKRNQASSP